MERFSLNPFKSMMNSMGGHVSNVMNPEVKKKLNPKCAKTDNFIMCAINKKMGNIGKYLFLIIGFVILAAILPMFKKDPYEKQMEMQMKMQEMEMMQNMY